ncbi:sugar phosphate isomerase/epimerase family protein [Actinomadura rupiterrae]|uniref:sugar phosphate isomerase/epimerase family protein n=1 Tax=Actinomadura rupiterrae TaxID=559627 RepID=UPI0020A594F9|nr:sugar phosphate isomerase/epimerase family protein [Actinomadura rupiterrae]MCP2338108.1 sugar phosphate isomerase/epimerase [Actinomadura rupiterrae]
MVKTAVSTLGMPGCGLADAIELATAFKLDGLELRLHPDTGIHAGLPGEERRAVRAAIEDAGLEIPVLAGYVRIAAEGPDEPAVAALRADLQLASDLGAEAVRVFPGGNDLDAATRRLLAVADLGVRVLVEIHDDLPTGASVATLLNRASAAAPAAPRRRPPSRPPSSPSPGPDTPPIRSGEQLQVGAIWDVLHPWRSGEHPDATVSALGQWLDYVQIKDAASDLTPVPLGTGGVPLDEVREALAAVGYEGWISLEWERTWYPHSVPVEEALPGALAWIDTYRKA